jgi:hypothetical protein
MSRKISSMHLNGIHSKNMMVIRGLKKGESFMAKDCKHAKNETIFSCKGKN